ncbi:MAG: ferredoxin [Thermotoga sp.]|nr:4Fe-4S binding protein [Thermotogota bacterium]RKX51529.1 MAG: ferredoxin [Thermotoga sp.]
MRKKNYDIRVNESWCKACGICVDVCPGDVFVLAEGEKADPAKKENCTGCMQCVNLCPELAIEVVEKEEEDEDERVRFHARR